MTRNQLPDGVGKKIVEALKRQAEADIAPITEVDDAIGNSVPLSDINEAADAQYSNKVNELDSFDSLIVEEDNANIDILDSLDSDDLAAANEVIKEVLPSVTPVVPNVQAEVPVQPQPQVTPVIPVPPQEQKPIFNSQTFVNPEPVINPEPVKNVTFSAPKNIDIPANVATLRNLIAGLPAGVTKQTGAQIIRQTLEAMGIPMTNVLKEAQDVQEELNSSARECMLKIQEYKANILQLEQSVQEYQKSITQINDLVSLFLLTDK